MRVAKFIKSKYVFILLIIPYLIIIPYGMSKNPHWLQANVTPLLVSFNTYLFVQIRLFILRNRKASLEENKELHSQFLEALFQSRQVFESLLNNHQEVYFQKIVNLESKVKSTQRDLNRSDMEIKKLAERLAVIEYKIDKNN